MQNKVYPPGKLRLIQDSVHGLRCLVHLLFDNFTLATVGSVDSLNFPFFVVYGVDVHVNSCVSVLYW